MCSCPPSPTLSRFCACLCPNASTKDPRIHNQELRNVINNQQQQPQLQRLLPQLPVNLQVNHELSQGWFVFVSRRDSQIMKSKADERKECFQFSVQVCLEQGFRVYCHISQYVGTLYLPLYLPCREVRLAYTPGFDHTRLIRSKTRLNESWAPLQIAKVCPIPLMADKNWPRKVQKRTWPNPAGRLLNRVEFYYSLYFSITSWQSSENT